MKIFNLITLILFAPMIVLTFVGGFYNWIHWCICAALINLSLVALHDDFDGNGSVYEWLRGLIQ